MMGLGKRLKKADWFMLGRLVGARQQVVTVLVAGAVLLCAGCGVAAVAAPSDHGPVPAAAGLLTAPELQERLLGAHDLPPGFAAVTTLADEDGGALRFQGDPACRELTQMLNADKVPEARAEAAVALSSGPVGGAAAEQLFAMASSPSAAGVVDRYRRAVDDCPEVQLGGAGAGSETFALRRAPVVGLAENRSAAVVGAMSGDSTDGQDIIQVVAHSGSVVIVTTFIGVPASSAELLAQAALDKVHRRLGA